jgi:hypothetical protein
MKKLFLIFCLFITFQQTFAQLLDNNFLLQVKQIDEFIDRFNNSKQAFNSYAALSKTNKVQTENLYKMLYGSEGIDRISMILSLFNYESVDHIGREKVKKFVMAVTDSTKAKTLNFYDLGWYASVTTDVLYKGRKYQAELILKNEYPENTREVSYWAIIACKADFLRIQNGPGKRQGINAGAHGVNFIPLVSAFEDSQQIASITSKDFKFDDLTAFLYASKQGEIVVKNVNTIKYHFTQIDGWIFTVDYFGRNTTNSGWLISDLIEANDNQKAAYKKQILFVAQ